MNFQLNHKLGESQITISFEEIIDFTKLNLDQVFQKIGGYQINNKEWSFPLFVSSQIIETIIKNTCFKCGGSMKPSKAFMNEIVSFNDFGNDAGQRGTTQSPVGKPELINVNKCSLCGHSYKT